ncbi:MAG TPA: hypothetical protein VFA70_15075 [Dehalococcoidia bacterium]|jgi:hypothetical protein|nr:hypothetical protein [Dehalococcoidia bacterium]
MPYRPDIRVYDRDGALVAIVQAKALRNADVEAATRYMANLLGYGFSAQVPYVLLITAETGYLWTSTDAVRRHEAPQLTFSFSGVLRHYQPDSGAQPVGDIVLGSVVSHWLWDLAYGTVEENDVTRQLRDTGLVRAIRDGEISVQLPV